MLKFQIRLTLAVVMLVGAASAEGAETVMRRAPTADWREDVREGFGKGQAQGVVVSEAEEGLILAFSGENLLTDPGFEGPAEKCEQTRNPYSPNPQPTNGWEHNGLADKSGAVRPAPSARSGKGAWELVDAMTPGEPALLQRVVFKPEYRGMTFVFSVWARTREGTNREAMIAFKFKSTTHWRSDVAQRLVVGPEWKQYSVAASMPTDADVLGVVIGPSSYEGQGAIMVDEALLAAASYAPSGAYTSQPRDMGDAQSALWRATYRAKTPPRTRVELRVRTGQTDTPDRSWSAWEAAPDRPDAALRTPPGRYLQYQLRLASADADKTPVVER
ncbi:MAG: hypothetical protein FJ278_18195, partial [Planctomycetes bacterium]|nr:hypothetical protein [Planctomycetota bacterium]